MNIRTPPHQARTTANTGFSLVELLMVTAVVLIAASIALVSGSGGDAVKLRRAAQLLIADIEYAQAQSAGNATDPVCIVFDVPQNRYWLARSSDLSRPITDPGSGRPYETEFGTGRAHSLSRVQLQSVEADDADVLRFALFGALLQASDASVVLRNDSGQVRITVDSTTGEPFVD